MPTHQVKLSARKSCCPDKKAALPCCYLHCFLLCPWEEHTGHNTSCQASPCQPSSVPSDLISAHSCSGGLLWKWMPQDRDGRACRARASQALGSCPLSPARHTRVRSCARADIPWVTARLLPLETQHPAGLELLLSIWAHLWQEMCWCPEVLSLFPGSWITGMWRTAQWNSGRQMLRLITGPFYLFCLFVFWSSQPIKPSSITFLLKAFEKPAESCTIPWQFCGTESDWQATDQLLPIFLSWSEMSWRLFWSLPLSASCFEFYFLPLISTWHLNLFIFLMLFQGK